MFLAVGCWDDTVQLLSLDPADVLGKGPAFSVESRPTSLCLVEMLRDTSAPAQDSSSRYNGVYNIYVVCVYICMYACIRTSVTFTVGDCI